MESKSELNLQNIKGKIIKNKDGISDYTHISIEEMDWVVNQAEKLQIHLEAIGKIYSF